jgi:hypothetical protein
VLREIVGGDVRRILVIGIGGGGDVVGSVITYNLAINEGIEATLGAVLWERYVVDIVPGPIRVDELRNAEYVGSYIAIVDEDTYAIREGRRVVPQIVNVLNVIRDDGVGISIAGPVIDIARELSEYVGKYGIDAIIGIDVGGDAIATGNEEGLYSPLADSYAIAVLAEVGELIGVPTILGVAGPGVDGELDRDYVMMRLSQLASRGAFLGAYGPTRSDLSLLEEILSRAVTEASALVYRAARGFYGNTNIRGGARTVRLDLSSSITYYIDLKVAINDLPIARMLIDHNVKDPWDAMRLLNSRGIVTELNFEEEIYRYYKATSRIPSPEEAYLIIRELKNRIRSIKQTAGQL